MLPNTLINVVFLNLSKQLATAVLTEKTSISLTQVYCVVDTSMPNELKYGG